MSRCNELCTKEATGTCALCDALAERERFIRVWLKGGFLVDGFQALRPREPFACLERCFGWLIVRLADQHRAPGCWLYPSPRTEVRHQDVVREDHKQYSETLNKTMLTLLGVSLVCLLITLISPDTLLLAASSMVSVPLLTHVQMSFVAFLLVAPLLLIALFIYLHVFYGYWLECERERRSINQRLIPPLASIPTLFAFPDAVPRRLTQFIFYWLVPCVLYGMMFKAWAIPSLGLALTYEAGFVMGLAWVLFVRRHCPQEPGNSVVVYVVLLFFLGFMVHATLNPQAWQRPFQLFRVDLAKAWLPRLNMWHAFAVLVNFHDANLFGANFEGADLRGANFQGAELKRANLQGADLRGQPFYETKLMGAKDLTQEQVNTACVNEHTQLPEGLIRPPPCPAKP